jgi:hypothetical protein
MIPLNDIPDDAQLNKIDASAAHHGRPCLRLALDASSRAGKFRVDFVDKPSFLLLPHVMQDGVIEVDLCARLLPDAPDYARSFIGLAYRVQDDLSTYESLYLRPTNGHPQGEGAAPLSADLLCKSSAGQRLHRGMNRPFFAGDLQPD